MKKKINLPVLECKECKSNMFLEIRTRIFQIKLLKIKCEKCSWNFDLLEKSSQTFETNKKRAKQATKYTLKQLIKLKKKLPKDKKELKDAIKNPRHPLTASILSGIVLIFLEMSGFSIFLILTWILGNLILNPLGWFLIPIVVAVIFYHRDKFKKNKITEARIKFKLLDAKKKKGKITEQEFKIERNKLISKFFK